MGSLFLNKVTVKEEMKSWFQELGYGYGFGPGEVPSTDVRKRKIGTHVILSVANLEGRRSWVRVKPSCFFGMHDYVL